MALRHSTHFTKTNYAIKINYLKLQHKKNLHALKLIITRKANGEVGHEMKKLSLVGLPQTKV